MASFVTDISDDCSFNIEAAAASENIAQFQNYAIKCQQLGCSHCDQTYSEEALIQFSSTGEVTGLGSSSFEAVASSMLMILASLIIIRKIIKF